MAVKTSDLKEWGIVKKLNDMMCDELFGPEKPVTKAEIYENALRTIARHALRRRMVIDPVPLKEYYDPLCGISKMAPFGGWDEFVASKTRRNELAEIFEHLGDIAVAALEDGEKADA